MVIVSSVVSFKDGYADAAETAVAAIPEVEVHQMSRETGQIVITIEGHSDRVIEQVAQKIQSYDFIHEVAHHAIHFEEEVNKYIAGEKPEMKGFFRSKRREERE